MSVNFHTHTLNMKKTLLTAAVTAMMAGCSVTPEKLTEQDVINSAAADSERLKKEALPITGPVDLYQAFARTIKNNREARLKAFEALVQQGQISVDRFDMLPELAAKAGYTERNHYAASASVTFDGDNPEPLPADPSYSVSSDKSSFSTSIGATWDVLDFGLSYYRAKQQADRFLIAKERERKVVHTIMQDVRRAYYRAVSAERLLTRIGPLITQARTALDDATQIENMLAQSPMQALTYQRDLLESLRTLQGLRQDLIPAKAELATLMGLNPGESFSLADVDDPDFSLPVVNTDVDTMERTALVKRPELIEARYQERITQQEVHSAFLNLFPHLSLSGGYYYDDSDYLKYNDWTSAGVGLNWNLMNVFRYGSIEQLNDLKVAAGKQQTLAKAMSVISQVHIANIQFGETIKSYQLADQYMDVARRIRHQVASGRQTQSAGELALIREDVNELLSEVRRDVAYADLQNSFGRLMISMGLDPLPSGFGAMNLEDLSKAFAEKLELWEDGYISTVSQQDMAQAASAIAE